MSQIINQICGDKLGALDGEIGHVKDVFFDDRNWAVRYLVADTGSWMLGRQVLISPYAINEVSQRGKVLRVNLTRQQIENSPSIESHKPVSRQYEEEYHQYYDWPFYWDGWEVWGMSGFPILPQRAEPFQGEPAAMENKKIETDDAHLRSAKTIAGYHIQAGDETIGRVTDFVMDEKSWVIQHLVVDTGHWLSDKKVLISPKQIQRVSWDASKVFVDLTKAAVLDLPAFNPASLSNTTPDPRVVM